MTLSKIARTLGLSAAVLALSAGSVFAAVATRAANVRTGPGTQYRAIDTLRSGERVNIVDRDGSWCEVTKSGPDGWVSCGLLADNTYRDDGRPSVSIQLGFGNNSPNRWHNQRPPRHNDDGFWSGPRSSNFGNSGGSFGLSFSN